MWTFPPLLLVACASIGRAAVFRDEVGNIDFHHELLGLPQSHATFFHKPRKTDKASLLFTLSDIGVLGAINPSSGTIVWRHLLEGNITDGGGFLRAGDGESWIVSALGSAVHGWDAMTGRSTFSMEFAGEVTDLEMMELSEAGRKDVLVLYREPDAAVVRRLHGGTGHVVWELRARTADIALQVSNDAAKVYLVSLRGAPGAYDVHVLILDALNGERLNEYTLSTQGEVYDESHVMFVGANSVMPLVSWTDAAKSRLYAHVLGTKERQEFSLPADALRLEVQAAQLVQSEPHFLVHITTESGHAARVYHIDLKTKNISLAYSLPHLPGPATFTMTCLNANVYITRITEHDMILLSTANDAILGRWTLSNSANTKAGAPNAIHGGTSEVVKKSDNSFALRSALVTDDDDWILIQNDLIAWSRPEGLTGGVAAIYAEIPEGESLARTLEDEAHQNPLSAYIHRVNRHINDLAQLPDYLATIPSRVLARLLSTEPPLKGKKDLARDSFGFDKLAIIATRRGMLYALNTGENGKVVWKARAFEHGPHEFWAVKGVFADESDGSIHVLGSKGESVLLRADTGEIIQKSSDVSDRVIQSTVLVDSPSGSWLLPVSRDGQIVEEIPASRTPEQTVVVRGPGNQLRGLVFIPNGETCYGETTWTFALPPGEELRTITHRPYADPVASIGRVLGDRRVLYKYLHPNLLLVTSFRKLTSSLTLTLLDGVSGEILYTTIHDDVSAAETIECAISENWFTCSFFAYYTVRGKTSQKSYGQHLAIYELYESHNANSRGYLGSASNFSSLRPLNSPSPPALPAVKPQTFLVTEPITALQVTQTRQGVATRQLLAYLPESHSILGIPRSLIDPRRPIGRDPNPREVDEGLAKYSPIIGADPKFVISHEREILGVTSITTTPALVESTSLLLAWGVDVYHTRVTPSLAFDLLGGGFGKGALVATVSALSLGAWLLKPFVRRRKIDLSYKASL